VNAVSNSGGGVSRSIANERLLIIAELGRVRYNGVGWWDEGNDE
jgi:hypothetical protein